MYQTSHGSPSWVMMMNFEKYDICNCRYCSSLVFPSFPNSHKIGVPWSFFWTGTLHLINLKGVQRYSSRILSHKTFREGNGICRVVFMGFGIFWESYGQLAKHAWYETHNGCLESICFHPQGQKISVPKPEKDSRGDQSH